MITIGAITFAINVAVSILKRWIYPKYGKLGVQVSAFVISLIAALYISYRDQFPGLEEFVIAALALFSLTVTFYEVVLEKISWFKVNNPEVEQARSLEKKISLL